MKYYEYLALELQEFLDFQKAREKIMLRIVPYSSELDVEGIVHRQFLNMAVTYYYMLSSETEMIPLKSSHVDRWKIKESDIYKVALENTPKKLPAVFESTKDCLVEILLESIKKENITTKAGFKNLIMDLFNFTLNDNDSDLIWENGNCNAEKLKKIIIEKEVGKKEMYVLSNRLRIHGAACLLYPNCLKEIAGHIGSDLYIIPASIHELILLPVDKDTKLEELKSDVIRANEDIVEPENRLTDDIYIYERETDTIKIV